MQPLITVLWVLLGFTTFVDLTQHHAQIERSEFEDFHYGNFKEFLNHTLNVSDVVAIFHVQEYIECAIDCIVNLSCFSFNFAILPDINTKLHACHLLATDKFNHSESFMKSLQFHHYTVASPCESFPCQHGGTCQPLYDTNNYICACLDGTFGKHCVPVYDSCVQAPRAAGRYNILDFELKVFPVYCDQTSDGGGWTMVFKIVKGIASPKVGEFWNSESSTVDIEKVTAALDTTASHQGHYKNRIVNNWQRFNPNEARVVLYQNGSEVTSMKFNASGTDKLNWFTQGNLIFSPWNDLKTSTNIQHFDITGSSNRYFEISGPYVGCSGDTGWLVVTDGSSCQWEAHDVKPNIQYSTKAYRVDMNSHGDIVIADVLAVFIR